MLVASLLCFALILAGLKSIAYAQTPYYQGKQIRLIIGSSPGGGYDLWPRMMLRYLTKHIPGNPEIVPQNMPGAGGVVGANYVYGIAKPDGLTIGAFNPALYFDQLIKREEVKFDWSKFAWIGSPEQNDILHFIRTDAPYKTIDDLRNAKEPPKCGSSGTGTTGHYIPRLLEEVLGIAFRLVPEAVEADHVDVRDAQVQPLADVTPDELDKILKVNVQGVLWGIQAAAKKFKQRGHKGKIISASSIAGHEGFAMLGVYSVTKFAVRALTQAAAKEYASDGITVNAYCPGIVGTDMWDLIDEKLRCLSEPRQGPGARAVCGRDPPRPGPDPRRCGRVRLLPGGPGSDYMTGQSVLIEGGLVMR